ncbi:MAG: Gfo/Idh/MocA family oxidoreductase [Hyphomonadaceae bacterium]|nr:Gfo/Idh/MocA family oxidoreductase [Clostridia bacterium]
MNCAFIADYDTLLQDPAIDGVVVNAPTNMHTDLILKAANAGKHIFTEKVLALTVEDCLKIKQAIEKNNVKFSIALVHKCRGDLLFAKQMAHTCIR